MDQIIATPRPSRRTLPCQSRRGRQLPRSPRSNNSWLHNNERLLKGNNRCTLLMHPSDAKRLGLEKDATVAVASRVGRVQTTVELTTDMMAGVVSLPHGWGHAREGVRLGVAQGQPGVSINDLTDEGELDRPSGNAVLNGIPVQVERVVEPEPARENAATTTD